MNGVCVCNVKLRISWDNKKMKNEKVYAGHIYMIYCFSKKDTQHMHNVCAVLYR